MKSPTHLQAKTSARFSRPPIDSRLDCHHARNSACRRVIAVAMALLLFALEQGTLVAQQEPPVQPGWPQDYPNNNSNQYPNNDANGYPNNDPNANANNGQYAPDQGSPYGQQAPQPQPLSAAQLQQLVAPIALYPDTLVAQVLAASTYPQQVADADRWRQSQGYASPEQIAAGADAQSWDPSVKALTAFPQVLAELDHNLQWTTDLGNAYYNQPQDVLEAVQVMRQRAQAAGNLRSTPQEVVRYDQGNIEVEPANPQIVYVPAYNPWAVYGAAVAPYPGFSLLGALGSFLGSAFGSSPVRFGLGIAMTAFSHASWGWLAWGLSWLTQSILFHQSNYYSHSATVADWGFAHGGRRAFSAGSEWRHDGFNRAGSYARQGGGSNDRGFRPADRYGNRYSGSRPEERFGQGFRPFGGGYARAPEQAYNRFQPQARPLQEGRGAYGSRFSGGFGENYRGSGSSSSRQSQPYRAPSAGFPRGELGERSSGFVASRAFTAPPAKPARSGGFHLFGGGHAPKSYGGDRNFSGGHGHQSFGGGHAPKSFGGGKSFSGKRSGGGGHSSGGHGGGRHHR